MILNICMKFQEDIVNGFHVKPRHDFVNCASYKVQRGITPIQELWLLCSACRLMVLDT